MDQKILSVTGGNPLKAGPLERVLTVVKRKKAKRMKARENVPQKKRGSWAMAGGDENPVSTLVMACVLWC